jgi:transcriptional regulator with GAF, ATPase, and Fis domain
VATVSSASDGEVSAPTAWLEVFCNDGGARREAMREALHRAGIHGGDRPGVESEGPGVVLFDRLDPKLLEAIRSLSRNGLAPLVAVAAGRTILSAQWAWAILEAGAADVLTWDPSDPGAAIAARLERWQAIEHLVRSPTVQDYLVGVSPVWIRFLRQVIEVAAFSDASVLIIGESGTGKELLARLIHILDPRPDKKDLIVLDSTTIVPELSGSEFFGHERGAFTGAVAARDGAFGLADRGTLFLDEVGELPPELQARMLRVVQEHTYKRVGGNAWLRTEFRLVCATNRDLDDEVERGRFRRDFLYRIASWTCRTPPLRERKEDIVPLARHFLQQAFPGTPVPDLDGPVLDHLMSRQYPGNVRDLQQLVARVARRHVGQGPITVGDLPPDERPRLREAGDWQSGEFDHAVSRAVALGVGLRGIGRAATEAAIRAALTAEAGSVRRAARRLGVTDRALQLRRARRDETPAASESSSHPP